MWKNYKPVLKRIPRVLFLGWVLKTGNGILITPKMLDTQFNKRLMSFIVCDLNKW